MSTLSKASAQDKIRSQDLDPDVKQRILSWVGQIEINTITMPGRSMTVTRHMPGDIVMHPFLKHPVLLLRKKKNQSWIGVCLTSDSGCEQILMPIQSRMHQTSYETNYITKCMLVIENSSLAKYPYLYSISSRTFLNQVKLKLSECFFEK